MSQDIYCKTLGQDGPPFFWAHGWGQTHAALLPLAQSLENMGRHWLVDFPGFGASPMPPEAWGTDEYADALAAFIKTQTDQPVFWVGHSFGCRVGLQLAARHPDLIKGMCLIAAAGLQRKRPLWQKLYFKVRIATFKFLKKLIPVGLSKDWLYKTFGSRDYMNAGPLRQVFVKVVNEDLSPQAAAVKCRVLLVYGAKDTETPPEIGERLSRLIPQAKLVVMDGFDHYTILSTAQHQVARHIHRFMQDNG